MSAAQPIPASVAPVRLTLRVVPGASGSAVIGRLGGAWKLRVRASPERGRANREVVELLARVLGVRRADVRIVLGHGARDKIVEIAGLRAGDVERRLTAAGART